MKIFILLMFAGCILFSCRDSSASKELQKQQEKEQAKRKAERAKDFFNGIIADLKPVVTRTDSLIEKIKRFDDSESIRSYANSNPSWSLPFSGFQMTLVDPDINGGEILKEKAQNIVQSSCDLFGFCIFYNLRYLDWQKLDSLVSSYYNNYDEFQEYQHVFMRKNQ